MGSRISRRSSTARQISSNSVKSQEAATRSTSTKQETSNIIRTSNKANRRMPVELGTISYVNLSKDGRHGSIEEALAVANETGKPIFANFVEWSGWQGCKDAGRIFADPAIKRVVEEFFVPCAFNTWDRSDPARNAPMIRWGAGLKNSWWGYLRIVDSEGAHIIAGTRQLTGYQCREEVRSVIIKALEKYGIPIPQYLV